VVTPGGTGGAQRRVAHLATSLWRDPVLLTLLGAAVAVCVWTGFDLGGEAARQTIFWPVQVALDAAFCALCWRVVRVPASSRTTRRFWRLAALAGLFFFASDLTRTGLQFARPHLAVTATTDAQTVMIIIGGACIMVALLAHPVRLSGAERFRFGLDAATIMVGVAMVLWYVFGGAVFRGAGEVSLLVTFAVLGLLCSFGMVKLVLGGNAPYTRAAGLAGGISSAMVALGTVLTPMIDDLSPSLGVTVRLLPCLLLAATPRIQELQMRADPDAVGRRVRRPFSLLAYATVGGSQIMLVTALLGQDPDASIWGVVVGAVLITGLVVVRQLTAFADNQRLVAELDSSVLAMRQQEERLGSLMRYSSEISAILDTGGRFSYVNPAIEPILGLTVEETLGGDLWSLVHPDDAAVIREAFIDLLGTPLANRRRELRIRHADGSWRWLSLVTSNLLDEPSVRGVVCNARDITETVAFQERLRFEATHDPLTRLANRALLEKRLQGGLQGDLGTADRTGPAGLGHTRVDQAAMLVIDLDDFKKVNDSLGHHAGDLLLRAVADRLRACSRETDTVARLGGDEFAVLLPGATAEEGARAAARILDAFAVPVRADGLELRIRASIGVAAGSTADAEAVMRAADAAMYAAKERGKDNYVAAG